MSAILKRIDDPRDALDKARRPELVAFARAHGLNEISSDMPAMLIRKRLRSAGLTRISVPDRRLGSMPDVPTSITPPPPSAVEGGGKVVDVMDDLERQFSVPALRKAVVHMSINELRAEMKRLGIKAERRDNIIIMRSKIEAHGKDPAQRSE